jgi:hypothetical protein
MITISCGGMVITIVVTQEGTKEDDTIPVGGVSLSTTTLSLLVGESETLTATVTPETATNQNVSWTSSNDNVATVDATGKVTAAKAGTADITVITEEGDRTAVCKVTVTAPLVFNDNTTFDIPASVTQMAIKNIYVLSGVSGGVKPYMFSAEGLPAGITIDASTGVISGTPTAPIAAGTAILTVKDASSPQQSQNIDIEYGEVAATATPDPDYFGTWRIQEYRQYTISVDGSISFEEFDRSEYNYTLTDLTWIPVTAPGDNYFAAEYPTGYRIVGMVAANGGSYYAPAVGSMYELCFFIHTDNGSLAVGMNGSGDRPYYPSDIWCIKQP